MPDITQLIYLIILLLSGFIVLYIRRKAKASKSFYKITLILLGVVLALFLAKKIDLFLLNNLIVFLFIVMLFELSMRLNPENLKGPKPMHIFLWTFILNILIIGTATALLLKINIYHALVFAIILTAIEYFMVDELRQEGDLANPLIILLAFSLIYFQTLNESTVYNITDFLQYIMIGIGVGIIVSIIIFKLLKPNKISWVHELALVCTAYLTYLLAEYLNGFGLLSVIIFGALFGNSYIRRKSEMKTLSPFIFKSLEILIFILIGFIVVFGIEVELIWKSIILYAIYLTIRFIVISLVHKRYSWRNKLLLTLAPKGIVFAATLLILFSQNIFVTEVKTVMIYILLISLLISWIMEYIEEKKIKKMDRFFDIVKNLRYGRKKLRHKHL